MGDELAIRRREMSTARTEDNPVLKLGQCKLINEKLWLDWSKWISLDSFEILLVTERSASSSKTTGGGATVDLVDVFFHSSMSCSSWISSTMDCAYPNILGGMDK